MYRFFAIFFFLFSNLYVFSQEQDYIDQQFEMAESYHINEENDSVIFILNTLLNNLDTFSLNDDLLLEKKAIAYDKLGIYYQKYGEWIKSAICYNNGLQLLYGNEDILDIQANLNLHLGLLYVKLGLNQGDFYLDKSEEQAVESNENDVLAILYKVTNRVDEGIKFAKANNDSISLSNYYYLKANGYEILDSIVVKSYFDSSRNILKDLNDLADSKLQHFQFHAFLSSYFVRVGKIDSAMYHCKIAEEVSILFNDFEVKNHLNSCFSKVYAALGDSVSSKYHLDKIIAVNDQYLLSGYLDFEVKDEKKTVENVKVISNYKTKERVAYIFIGSLIVILVIILLSARKIRKINRQLMASNITRDRLFSIISHDLRGVIASLNILSKKEDLDNMRRIHDSSDMLLIEFDNLLYWSSQHLDKIKLNQKVIDLNEIIDEIIKLLETQISEKNQRIIYNYSDEFIAYADQDTIRVVLRNILHNAIKYSPLDSEIIIKMVESQGQVCIDVYDKGTGFGNDQSDKGLGLGLNLCRDLLKLNGGRLEIKSSEDGSCVSVILKVVE